MSVALETASVVVLSGGPSSERDVSLDSGRAIAAALDGGGMPRSVRSVEIDVDGRWVLEGTPVPAAHALARLEDVDVFFLGLHGAYGEDGTLQGLLEATGHRYTGSGVGASAVCMDKQALRLLAADAGLRVAPGLAFSAFEWRAGRAGILARIHGAVGERAVVKPRSGGSSVGTAVVQAAEAQLMEAVEAALAEDGACLVEAFVPGVEVSCGVLGNADEALRSLPPIEIQPAEGRFFDYQQKYDPEGAREVCPAERLSDAQDREVRAGAVAAHRLAGCDGYSRADFIVPAEGPPVLLEVNTLPGMTPRSLLPQEAAAAGLGFRDLCLEIVARALARGR